MVDFIGEDLKSLSVDHLEFVAYLAEQSERYDDMAVVMQHLAVKQGTLTSKQRNYLSVAFKNSVGTKRSAWRTLKLSSENKDEKNAKLMEKIESFRKKISEELVKICNKVIEILNNELIPKSTDDESKVFYLKMVGDYYRYYAEVAEDYPEKKDEIIQGASTAYLDAYKKGQAQLPKNNPIFLGLCLNYSVFLYEIVKDHENAIKTAKMSLDDAVAIMEQAPADIFKDSTLILQLIKDNLTLWTASDSCDDDIQRATERKD